MRVFVTGGNGFIGSRVVTKLCDRGYQVRCLLRQHSQTQRIDGLPLERVVGDLFDPAYLTCCMFDCQACIHLAAISSWDGIKSATAEDIIVRGTQCVLEAVRAEDLRFVYVSSAAAINGSFKATVFDEKSAFELDGSGLRYAIAKHKAEAIVFDEVRKGVDAVVVNPAETYGAHDDQWVTAGSIRDVLHAWPAVAVRGGTSIVHVDDVADGIIRAMEKGRSGHRYILAGENLTIKEIVHTVLALSKQRKPVITLPSVVVEWIIRAVTLLGLPSPLPLGALAYATRFWYMDSTKARTELGYCPRSALETLQSVVDWIQTTETEKSSACAGRPHQ